MTRRVVLSIRAGNYISSEVAYLRRHSIRAARRFREIVELVRRNLERFDEIGGTLDAPPIPGLRRLVVQEYLFDYMPGDPIVIVSVRHGRQRPEAWETSYVSEEDE